MKIYVSTGLVKNKTTPKIANDLIKNKICDIEFSSGKFEKDILKKIKRLNINPQIHNYFPVPKKPFIINLASTNTKIFNQTMKHIKR